MGFAVGTKSGPRMTIPLAARRILQILTRQERHQALALLGQMLLTSLIELTGFLSILPLVTLATDPGQIASQPWLRSLYDWSGAASPQKFFLMLAGSFVLLFAATEAAHCASAWYANRFSYRVRHRLSVQLLSCYLGKPHVWFLRRNSSHLMKAILRDVDQLVNDCLMVILSIARRGLTTAGIVLVLIGIEPRLTLGALLFFWLLYGALAARFRRRIGQLGLVHHEVNNQRFKAVQEGLAAIQEGRIFFRRHHVVESYRQHSWQSSLLLARYHLLRDLPNRVGHLLGVSSIIALLVYFASSSPSQKAVPLVGVFVLGIWRVGPALQALYSDLSQLRFELPVLESLFADLAEPVEGPSTPDPPSVGLQRSLDLTSVSFTYPEAPVPAIADLTLSIPVGASVGVVGSTGAGKTTLVDLVGGFLSPESGAVTVDGVSLADCPDWGRNIGYVPQSVYIADDSVRRNIALGVPDPLIDQEALVRAARLAGIHDFVMGELPGQYDALLGERGACLSGGQCQRIGIARALYHDPDLLILDEATSSLDSLTERSVLEAIRGLARTKTLLVVTHRLATVRWCNPIVLLEGGRMVARGTYQELMAESPAFRRLAQEAWPCAED